MTGTKNDQKRQRTRRSVLQQAAAVAMPLQGSGWFDLDFNMFGDITVETQNEVVVSDLSTLVIAENMSVSSTESGVATVSATSSNGRGAADFAVDEGDITIGSGESYPLGRFVVPSNASIIVDTAAVMDTGFVVPAGVSLRYWNDTEQTTLYETTSTWAEPNKELTGYGGDNIIVEMVNSDSTNHTLSGSTNARFE